MLLPNGAFVYSRAWQDRHAVTLNDVRGKVWITDGMQTVHVDPHGLPAVASCEGG